ncbi:MAG: hypothetical protein PHN74_01870 [Candidatus Pacebacteria bacterium]|nr:hypothetical protein [Candidatus Paceibacterota bacterium]
MNYKRLLVLTIGAVFSANVVLPTLAFADPSATTTSGDSVKASFCAKLTASEEKTNQKLAERAAVQEKKQQDRLAKFKEVREGVDNMRNIRRAWWDENRTSAFTKIEKRAKTDSEKAAAAAFKIAAEAAVAARKTSVDAAVSAYRTGVDQLVAERKTAIVAAISNFATSVKTVIDKAKADCASGADSKTVKKEMKASLKDVRNKLESDRKAIEKVGISAKDLSVIKKAAFTKAAEDFKAAIEKARATLMSAFGNKEKATTTSQ